MLIDRFLPHCDFFERHSTRVNATPERIYEVVRHGELAVHPVVRALLFLRGMSDRRTSSLDRFLHQGFSLIGEDPPREILLGIEGPFWRPRCTLQRPDFTRPVPSGMARGAWNFRVEGNILSTETRVLCAEDARAKFRVYWLFVRPFSGLIRRLMLRAIRREAERG